MINLINLLKEIVVKPTVPYKYELGQKVPSSVSGIGIIIDRVPDGHNIPGGYEVATGPERDNPCYLIQWPNPNRTSSEVWFSVWYSENELTNKFFSGNLKEIVVKPAKPFVFKKGDKVKEMYGDEQSAIVIDRVEDFTQVKKDPKGVDIGWIYQDEDQVTKPWYFVEYASKAFGWEPEDELELDVDDLQEIVVKPTKAYKFRVGMTVKEKSGDQELCKILDVKPNYRTIVDDPEYRHYGHDLYRSRIQNDTDFAEPFYLVKWLEHNTHAEPSWWPESDLEAVKQNKVNEIIVKPTSSYRFDIGDRIRNKVGGVLIVKNRYKNKEEVLKAYPYETAWIENQAQYDKDGNSFWYRLSDKEIENKTASPTLAPEIRLIEKGWVKL
jgi:hypothetical protein